MLKHLMYFSIFNAKKPIGLRFSHKSGVRKSQRKSECTSKTVALKTKRIAWGTLSMWSPRSQNCSHTSSRSNVYGRIKQVVL